MIHLFRNFLSPFDAECMERDIMAAIDTELFYAFYSIEKEEPLHLDNRLDNQTHIEHHKQVAGISLQQKEGLHYRFKQSLPHTEECPCFECVFRNKALKTFVKEFIAEKLEWEEAILAQNFISAFYPGDFLSTHNDDHKGAGIAFSLYLNKDWKPEYGGMLNVKQGDGTYLAIEPQFNSLVVMELGDEGIDHFVSEVSAFAPKPRIAISGWYNKGDGASNESSN